MLSPRLALRTAAAALVLLAACDGLLDPTEQYTLISVNGSALPAPYPDPAASGDLQVTAGVLTLHEGGRLTGSWTMACPTSLPEGSTCEVTGDGRQTFEGTYSREDGVVFIGDHPYLAEFRTNGLEFTVQLPPSLGLSPRYVLRYDR